MKKNKNWKQQIEGWRMNQLKYCDQNQNDEHIRIIQKKYLNLKLQQWMAGSVHADIYNRI